MEADSRQHLTEAFNRRDLERFIELLDPDVVWTGLKKAGEPTPVCRNRDEVREVFERALAAGRTGSPLIVAEQGDAVVIDPRAEPVLEGQEELHHVYTFRGGRIVAMRDYPNRRSALEAVGLR